MTKEEKIDNELNQLKIKQGYRRLAREASGFVYDDAQRLSDADEIQELRNNLADPTRERERASLRSLLNGLRDE